MAKRKIKSKAKGNKGGLSDADKILLQLLLDVRSFGDTLKTHGVDHTTNEEYVKLLAEVIKGKRGEGSRVSAGGWRG